MKLKEHIQAHRNEFDDQQISSKADQLFDARLKQEFYQPNNGKMVYLKYISVAASIALLISIGFYTKNEIESSKNKKEVLASLEDDSAGTRLEGVYRFNDEYEKEDQQIISTLIKVLHKDGNANVKIAIIESLLKFPKNEKIRTNLVSALEKEETPLVQIKLIKALSVLRENRAQKSLKQIINNEQTFPIVKNNATLAMVELKK
tara:strand:+ start:3843 stop:4454 length:612 start_codon:yes stop_codon:yes gene_type:complete